MLNKINKRYLLILAVICILTLIPASFAEDAGNDTLCIDADVGGTITAGDDIIYVSDGDDEGEGTFNNPYNSISKAVNEYNSTVNSEIYIKNGNYVFTDQIELKKDINIVGQSKEGTILDGNFQTSMFKVSGKYKITLTNLTFKNADTAPAIDMDFLDTLEVDNCIFENNNNCAIRFKTIWSNDPSIIVKNSCFKDNYYAGSSGQEGGAAISMTRGTILNVTNSIFENNKMSIGESSASQGGAIYTGGNIKTLYIDNCKFYGNVATKGSAISQYCGGDFYLYNSVFMNNTSPGNSKYKINSSVIFNNQANSNLLYFYTMNNTIENNSLNDEIVTEGNIKIVEIDKNIRITASDVEKYYGDDFNYKVSLTDLDGNPLVNKEIIVTLTNTYDKSITTISNVTDANGIATISLKNQKVGKYAVVAKFNGDSIYDAVSTTNTIKIRIENDINLIFDPSSINITEGDSYNVTGFILDEYLQPTDDCNGITYSISWLKSNGYVTVIEGGSYKVDGNKIVFDINRCHLNTRDEPYIVYFNITDKSVSGNVTVYLNKINSSKIDENIEVIYVSKNGDDNAGDASKENPLATIQAALTLNHDLGGEKTIMIDEGVYEISTFTIQGNVTVIGKKSKTILKQTTGNLGMFEIDNGNTVNLINLTFTNGYTTPEPDSLIHVTDESVAYIDGCEFYDNHGMHGGAISVSRHASAYINNCYFHENDANISQKVTWIGGAIYVHDPAYLYVANSVFVNNTARDGGAIYLGYGSVADIINSTFEDNSAIVTTLREGGGGAIYTRTLDLNIINSTFKHNYAELYAGAIYIDCSALEITDDFDLDVEYPDLNDTNFRALYIEKSYFENNYVKYNSESKGSAIENSYLTYINLIMHDSILISSDEHENYMVLIHNYDANDENYTVDLRYNLWKTNSMQGSPSSADKVRIVVSTDNEYIYTGDVVEFTVEFVNYNSYNGTSALNNSVHDLFLNVIPKIGSVDVSNITIKDNKAKFIYSATTVGSEVIYFENIFNFTNFKFDVLDGSDKVDINHTIDVDVNKTSTITVNLDADIDDNITIRVNDKDYSVQVKDKKAVLDVETSPGDYSVQVIFAGNDVYKGFIGKTSFNVAKYSSNIVAEDVTVFFNGKFEAVLKDSEGNPISDEILNINVGGTDYTVTTDENGIATLNLNFDSVGEYNVITSFNGNKNYNATQKESKITVIYTNIKLVAPDVVITPLEGSFKVTVTDNNNNPLNGVNVRIVIKGVEYNVKTVSDGAVTIDLTNNSFEAGKIDVSVNVEASGVYGANSTTATITVEKITAAINTTDVSVFSNNGVFTAVLVDLNGNPISNKTIIFEVDGKTTEILTDSDGQATLKLNLTSGNYIIVSKLKENKLYTADDSTSTIKVSSNDVVINAPDVVVYYSNGKFNVTLTDVNGNPISSDVIITLNGLNLITTTDSNGFGSIPINLDIGIYVAIVQFRGNNLFKSANTTSNITVLSSIESKDLTRAYMSPYDFESKLIGSDGNPLVNETVSLVVNGQKYNVTTDSEGVLKLSQNLSVGRYVITVINPSTGEEAANYADIVNRITGNANLNMYYGAGKSYKVRIYSDDGQVAGAGEIVTFKIGGKTYTRQTDSNGYASIVISLKSNTYTITATYKGVKVSNKVVVKPVLTAKNISKKKAKTIKFSAKLVNTNGKVLKGKKITFKFKGKTYKVKTNKKGIATLSLKNLKVGKYTIKTTYGKSTIKNTIKIKK